MDSTETAEVTDAVTDVHQMSATEIVEAYDYLLEDATPLTRTGQGTETADRVFELLTYATRAHSMAVVEQFLCREEPCRFSELKATLDVPPKALSARLRELVDRGFVTREQFDENPPRVEYELTEKMTDLRPAFQFLFAWAERHDLEPASPGSIDDR